MMGTTQAELRVRLRQERHEEEPAAVGRPGATLKRHLQAALKELARACPRSFA